MTVGLPTTNKHLGGIAMDHADRPAVWVGHITMNTTKLDESEAFMKQLGLRGVFRNDAVAVLELRGGTHLVVIKNETATPANTDFDFMVEDLDKTYTQFKADGLVVSEVRKGEIHDSFEITEPGGNQITFNSTHVADHALV